jgi:hypothetical protein
MVKSKVNKKTKNTKKVKGAKKDSNMFYNGKRGIKKAGVVIDLTEEQEEEIRKCANDPIYFINNYIKIRMADRGIQQIILRDYQEDFIMKMVKDRFLITMMARQMGKTSTVAMLFLWYILFYDNFTILVLANIEKKAKDIIKLIKPMIKNLPLWMQEGVEEWNKLSITFENGSSIEAEATKEDSGRGGMHNIVYVDEMAFISDNIIGEMMKAAFPVISSGQTTKLIITSTPKGKNYFWKMWANAVKGVGFFKHVYYDWTMLKTRKPDFERGIIDTFGERYWAREFLCSFEGTSETFLSPKQIGLLSFMPPIKEIQIQKEQYLLRQYVAPIKDRKYILTLDPSEGIGQDFTGIHVWDVSIKDVREEVAVMYNNILSEVEAPFIIKDIAAMYNDALVVAENNKCERILDMLIEKCDYDNIFFNELDNRYGIRMSEAKKRRALKQMEIEFEKGRLIIHDYDYIHELSVFVKKGKSYEADKGEHDDLVMSSALLFWIMSYDNLYAEHIQENSNYMKDVHGIDNENGSGPLIFMTGVDGIEQLGKSKPYN